MVSKLVYLSTVQALGSLMLVPPYLHFPVALMSQLLQLQLQQISIECLEASKLQQQNIHGQLVIPSKHLKRGLGLSVWV